MILLTFNANHLFAAGSSEPAVEAEALSHKIVATVKAGEYQKAISEFRSFIKTEKNNANAWNWLGYSERKNGNYKASLKAYKKALKIDKKHLRANEYLGELYLSTNKPRLVKKQLKRLAKYCGECEEYHLLSASIASYNDSDKTHEEEHDY